jgi:cytochrome d ubiquinol oxidase subunit I
MAGLGTLFIAVMAWCGYLLFRKKLAHSRSALWLLMLFAPLPYVANTAGWMTAELGRQPWLIHGLMRTRDGFSTNVSPGNALFSLMGFMGLYALLALLYFFVITKILARGPDAADAESPGAS